MTKKFFLLLFSTILIPFCVVSVGAETKKIEGSFLKDVELEKQSINGKIHYRYKPDIYLTFADSIEGTSDDFGLRLSVVRVSERGTEILYSSRGSGDSYILRPSFFSSDINQGPLLILAETGTEYSWGARVFLINQNNYVTDLGLLDVAVEPDLEYTDGTESIVPYTKIKVDGDRYVFTFTKDVVFDPGGLNEVPIAKDRIKYIFDGASLTCVKAPSESVP